MEEILNGLITKKVISREEKDLIEEYNNRLKENQLPIIYNLRHLRKIFNIRKKDQEKFFGDKRYMCYKTFFIPKKSKGYRKIEASCEELKDIQKWIKINILEKMTVSDHAKGFKKGSSIIENAQMHVDKKLVINIDMKNFFSTIHYDKVFKLFIYYGYNREVSHLLTKLCTNSANVLPQGAPTSPILSNILSLKLDKRLLTLSDKFNANYTRYADDITFSGNAEIAKMIPIIKKIIADENYLMNYDKFRLQYSDQTQMVTGIIVNKKLGISKKLRKEISNAIYYCKKFGVDKHMENIFCDRAFYKEHLYGIAYFAKSIDEKLGEKYINGLNEIDWIY